MMMTKEAEERVLKLFHDLGLTTVKIVHTPKGERHCDEFVALVDKLDTLLLHFRDAVYIRDWGEGEDEPHE